MLIDSPPLQEDNTAAEVYTKAAAIVLIDPVHMLAMFLAPKNTI
jgi:hypothetical protein